MGNILYRIRFIIVLSLIIIMTSCGNADDADNKNDKKEDSSTDVTTSVNDELIGPAKDLLKRQLDPINIDDAEYELIEQVEDPEDNTKYASYRIRLNTDDIDYLGDLDFTCMFEDGEWVPVDYSFDDRHVQIKRAVIPEELAEEEFINLYGKKVKGVELSNDE